MVDRARAYSVFVVICIALALNFWFGIYTAEATSNTMLVSASKSQTKNKQTFREDARLTNSCIEADKTKAHCLCVTSIYKHQLNTREYNAAVMQYETEKNSEPKTLKAAHARTNNQTYSALELERISAKRRSLLGPKVFENNCRNSKAYFERLK